MVRYHTEVGEAEPSSEGRAAVLRIEENSINGTMGVNRFVGQIADGKVAGPLALTRMAGPPELMRQEDVLIGHLQDADTITVSANGMFLHRDGLQLMELRRSGTGQGPEPS